MNLRCCQVAAGGLAPKAARVRITHRGPHQPSVARRSTAFAGWIVSAGILALLPKCPACIAAYLAIASGIGISITTAAYLRIGLLALSVASLSYFAASRGHRVMAWLRSAYRRKIIRNGEAADDCQ